MKTSQASNLIPLWQAEHAKLLLRACKTIKAAVARGDKIGAVICRVSRQFHGQAYESDPARRIALAPGTLRARWDAWQRSGENVAAFKLNYSRQPSPFTARVLTRFVTFCASRQYSSLRTAWADFSSTPGILGTATQPHRPFAVLCQNFPVAVFYQMQEQLNAISAAKVKLAQLQLETIADIRRRLPAGPRPKRKSKT